MEQFSKYQYITGCRIAFSDTWDNNCQLGTNKTKTGSNLIFK